MAGTIGSFLFAADYTISDYQKQQAWPILEQYNFRCQPPWNGADLEKKWRDAGEKVKSKDRTRSEKRHKQLKVKTTENGIVKTECGKTEFLGFLPDFAVGFPRQLTWYSIDNGGIQAFAVESFFICQLGQTMPIVPEQYMRQFFLQPPFPKNWRRTLYRKLGRWGSIDSFRSPEHFNECAHCQSGIEKHSHIQLTTFAHIYLRYLDLYDVTAEQRYMHVENAQIREEVENILKKYNSSKVNNARQSCFKKGILRNIYYPLLLLGFPAGFLLSLIRVACGITLELTRDSENSYQPMLIKNAKVPTVSNRQVETCPLLDPDQIYHVFGGNGRRRGCGYQLFGRNNRGWWVKLGFNDRIVDVRESRHKRKIADRLFNYELPRIEEQLQVIPVMRINNEWYSLSQVRSFLASGFGFDKICNAIFQFFVPEDWTQIWRQKLTDLLGYRSIPTTSSQINRPANSGFSDWDKAKLVEKLRACELGYAKLAGELSILAGKVVSKKRIQRHICGESNNVEFWNLLASYFSANSVEI